jgi:putative DNA primase/helicase
MPEIGTSGSMVYRNAKAGKLEKKSAISDWQTQATANAEQIKAWWRQFPDAVPAIELGRAGLVVLDLDRHPGAPDGVAAFKALRNGHDLPTQPVTRTASNGFHLIFRQPSDGEPFGNGRGELPVGCDVRGRGGWIVAVGATCEWGKWRPVKDRPGLADAYKAGTIPELPRWLREIIRPQQRAKPSATASQPTGKRERAYAQAALDGAADRLAATPRGNRNTELNASAFSLGKLIGAGWIGRSTVEGRLHDAAIACGYVADDGEAAVRSTIKSGIEAGLKEPHPDLKERDKQKGNGAANPGAEHTGEQGGKRLVVHRASEITPVAVDWLWPGRIATGKTTLVGGDPGLGKSQLAAFIAATMSRGGQWPCGEGQSAKKSVIVLCAEDGAADTIVPRLMAAQADREKVTIITAVTEIDGGGRRVFNLSKDLDVLEGLITGIGDVGLVAIDPVDAYLGAGAGGIDSHKNAAVRAVLEPLSELADRLRTAVLAVTHFSKQAGGKAMYRFIGSIAHIGSARVAFAVVADAENEGRVLLLHAKNNLASPQKGLAFRLEQHMVADGVIGSTVVFESEHVAVTADEALAADRDLETRTAKEEVKDFLADILAEGPQPVRKIEDEARAAGLLGGEQDIGQSKPFRLARSALGSSLAKRRGRRRPAGYGSSRPPIRCPRGIRCPSKRGHLIGKGHLTPPIRCPQRVRCPLRKGHLMGKGHLTPVPSRYRRRLALHRTMRLATSALSMTRPTPAQSLSACGVFQAPFPRTGGPPPTASVRRGDPVGT